jgi:carbonic anhydrase
MKNKILNELLEGNIRFTQGTTIHSNDSSLKKLKNFAQSGQVPKAIVLCCSDSRAPVEIIFDQDIGDLFVIRVAGNVVAPSLIGSVEFAATTFGTSLVLVMGHSLCGAVRATLDYISNPHTSHSENIQDIVSRIKPHISYIPKEKENHQGEHLSKAVEANVRASVDQLSHSSRIIESLIKQGQVEIHGAVLDLNTGLVSTIEI